MAQPASSGKSPVTWGAVTVLLTFAIIGTLWVPIYARSMPELGSFPFFYVYQLIWVPLTAVILWICYLLLRTKPARHAEPAAAPNLDAATVVRGLLSPTLSPAPLLPPPPRPCSVAADRGYYDRMKEVRGGLAQTSPFQLHASEQRIPLVGEQMRIGRRTHPAN